MSKDFEATPLNEEDSSVFQLYQIKPKDDKWKNFPEFVIPKPMIEEIIEAKNFKVFDDDVYLVGFPRSGTTLMQEMIWLILNDFNFEKAKSIITDKRFPLLETFKFNQKFYDGKVTLSFEDLESPRTIKTHLPVQLLPDEFFIKKPKMIHVSREVKDVAISMKHYAENMMQMKVDQNEYLQDFLNDKIAFTPYREHCMNYFTLPDYENILYLTYEWITTNMDEAIKRVTNFLNKSITDEQMEQLKQHLKFDSMKNNDACNNKTYMERMNAMLKSDRKPEGFIRKGKVGGYKDEMPEEFIEAFDKWMAESLRLQSGFKKNH